MNDFERELPDGPLTADQEAIAASLSPEVIARIDAALLANAQLRARKVAMIIGLTMMEAGLRVAGLPDLFYRDRVHALIKSGHLVAHGNVDSMRYSEVRLPSAHAPGHFSEHTPDGTV